MTLTAFLPAEYQTPEDIVAILPHGSGIDCSWTHDVLTNGDFVFNNSYHRMNDVGYYCGWIDFKVYMRLCRKTVIYPLRGPLKGCHAFSSMAGNIEITISGFRRNHHQDIEQYAYDSVYLSLLDHMDLGVYYSSLHGEVEAVAGLSTVDKDNLAYCTRALLGYRNPDSDSLSLPEHLKTAALITAKACRRYMEK